VATSKSKELNKNDWTDIAKNTGLVALVAGLSYITTNIHTLDMGIYGPAIVAIAIPVVNAVMKWARDNTNA
jgi:hypothetical protein